MVFGLFKKDRDTSEIDELLFEIQRLGRRMGGLALMSEAERTQSIRAFKLDVIINSVREQQELLLDARRQVAAGKANPRELKSAFADFRHSLVGYHRYLDVVNDQGHGAGNQFFIERAGIASYF
ncbi:MAG: hypothetical protein JNJ92_03675 [Altererythrobacter sp.]|nr:hypothetical protein [Altererythrobacter sp.]